VKSLQGFGGKAGRKETTPKTKAYICGRMGSEWILGRLAGGGLAQDRDRRRAVANGVINLRVLAPWN
jgi:hypothetical protein